ncbi:MAG: thiamine pyrophosphate-dependent enzyme [Candidatus Hadarchaeaceae archaeon]
MEIKDFDTPAKNTWCPGCNNFGILGVVKQVLTELVNSDEAKLEEIVVLSGVGCHGKISDYLRVNSFYCLHGRVLPAAMGVKVANQRLKVIAFAGDGDAYSEGISHVIHAARRNLDLTLIVHDNEVFALTTSQVTPTTKVGFRTKSAPKGSFETPLNPLQLMLACGATFVARGFSGEPKLLKRTMLEAVRHRGFSFIDVIQECVTFNPIREKYLPKMYDLNNEGHNFTSFEAAWMRAGETERIPLGIFYRVEKQTYEKQLLGEKILSEESPETSVKEVLQQFL